jgi:hypothetical protein
MPRNWIAVASANHATRGREDGFMQICHGKGGPLRRLAGQSGAIAAARRDSYVVRTRREGPGLLKKRYPTTMTIAARPARATRTAGLRP